MLIAPGPYWKPRSRSATGWVGKYCQCEKAIGMLKECHMLPEFHDGSV